MLPQKSVFHTGSDAACAFKSEDRPASCTLCPHKYFPRKFKHTQPLQGQSLEARDFVSSRNTWLDPEHFGNLLEITVV